MKISVADEIRKRRESLGLNQDDFAQLAKVPERTYQDYEAGKRAIPSDRLSSIARALGVRIADLFKELDDLPNPESIALYVKKLADENRSLRQQIESPNESVKIPEDVSAAEASKILGAFGRAKRSHRDAALAFLAGVSGSAKTPSKSRRE